MSQTYSVMAEPIRHWYHRFWPAVVSLAILPLLSVVGCGGSSDPYSYVNEKGKVTYDDGSVIPSPRIDLQFVSETPPADPKNSPPPGIADVNVADGTYDSIKSHGHEGVVRGKSKVLVKCMDEKDRTLNLVAPEYLDVKKTPLEANTDDPASFTFTVKKATVPAGRLSPGKR
jgi:hypothetical protein